MLICLLPKIPIIIFFNKKRSGQKNCRLCIDCYGGGGEVATPIPLDTNALLAVPKQSMQRRQCIVLQIHPWGGASIYHIKGHWSQRLKSDNLRINAAFLSCGDSVINVAKRVRHSVHGIMVLVCCLVLVCYKELVC
jgi:hypothetical protein